MCLVTDLCKDNNAAFLYIDYTKCHTEVGLCCFATHVIVNSWFECIYARRSNTACSILERFLAPDKNLKACETVVVCVLCNIMRLLAQVFPNRMLRLEDTVRPPDALSIDQRACVCVPCRAWPRWWAARGTGADSPDWPGGCAACS